MLWGFTKNKAFMSNLDIADEIKSFSVDFTTKEGEPKNGPLALLWLLIESYEVDIFHVSLTRITEDFLKYIQDNNIQLDEKSEFALMGAKLVFYKSRKLIPSDEIDDDYESDTLPIELVEQLLQYKKFQKASENLRELEGTKNLTVQRHSSWEEFERDTEIFLNVDLITLLKVFRNFLLTQEEKPMMQIEEEEINTEIILDEIREKLTTNLEISFFVFVRNFTLVKIIAVFLSILELAKMREITLLQNSKKDDILLRRK